MASPLALRRLLTKSLSASTLRPIAAAHPSASRLFNTNALRSSDDDDETDFDVDRHRSGRPLSRRSDGFFPHVFGPFSPRRSLTDVLNLMDQISENPYLSASRGVGEEVRRGWAALETADALHLRLDMPGLGKEDVKVSVEHNTLSIKGEGGKDGDGGDGEGETPRRYSAAIGLPEKLFKTDGVKAEMKNGVLKVVVPKVKEEERADVFQVEVE